MTQEALKLALEELAVRFSKGWHEGIKIDASDIMLLNEAAQALAQEKTLQALHSENERLGLYKDAYAQPEQKPVAWVSEDVCEGQYIDGRPRKIWWECEKGVGTAFYTIPPQRTWVGIPEQDLKQGDESFFVAWREGARWAEAKLKELNDHSI
jgi:hypothetical protein